MAECIFCKIIENVQLVGNQNRIGICPNCLLSLKYLLGIKSSKEREFNEELNKDSPISFLG